MRVRVQVIVEADDDTPSAVHEVACVERGDLHIDTLGLHLAEAKDLLQKVQEVIMGEQVRASLAEHVACSECGRAGRHKDAATIVMRTLFGTLHLRSPRWWHCTCQAQLTHTFSPLAAVLPERHTRTDLSGEQVLRVDLVWPERQLAGRDTATRACYTR
jgi:hypothetical protein